MTTDNAEWHVLGAGSIGCLFTAYLRRANSDITLLLRDRDSLALLQRNGGITLEKEEKSVTIPLHGVLAAGIDQPITHLLICTKAQQTLAAINSIKSKLASKPIIVLLQNGMGVRELLLQAIPDAVVLLAITTEGGFQRERFHIVHAGFGETFVGALHAYEQHFAAQAVRALRCELSISTVADIEQRAWLKLAINSVINPLSAVHECRTGELLKLPDIETTVAQLCSEFALVAQAEKQHFTVAQLSEKIMDVMHDTAANRTSMLQDIHARRQTEIDFINGYVVRCAQRHGIFCPLQTALFDAIKHKEHAFA